VDATSNLSVGAFSQNANFSVIRELGLPELDDFGWVYFMRVFHYRLIDGS
jgi:hypothetical protein